MNKLLILCIVFLLCGCFSSTSIEINRVSNSLNTIDAVIAEKETGATVATPTEIYLIAHGEKIHGKPVFLSDHTKYISLEWQDESTLIIHAATARVFIEESSKEITINSRKKLLCASC